MKLALLTRPPDAAHNRLYETNTGNIVYRATLPRLVDGVIEELDWSDSKGIEKSKADAFVVPLANVFRKGVPVCEKLLLSWKRGIARRPLIAVGLGAAAADRSTFPEISDELREWVSLFTAIFTRGDFTRLCLKHEGIDSVSGTCPSLFWSPDRHLGHTIGSYPEKPEVVGVTDAAGNWKSFLAEDVLLNFCKGDAQFFGQVAPETTETPRRNQNAPVLTPESRQKRRLYFDIEEWAKELTKHDLIIGPRFHGAMWAIQHGVPAAVVPIDSRTEEMCESTGVPSVPHEVVQTWKGREHIPQIQFDPEGFDVNRMAQARKLVKFFRENGVRPSEHLRSLA